MNISLEKLFDRFIIFSSICNENPLLAGYPIFSFNKSIHVFHGAAILPCDMFLIHYKILIVKSLESH